MFLLNVEDAIAGFKAADDCKETIPYLEESVDREKFMLFLRIMKAKCPSDISDISVEEIISLYTHIADFSEYFREKPSYVSIYQNRIKNASTVLLGRRIL